MTDDEFVFEDPPPPGVGHGSESRYEPLRKALVNRPGEWARIPGLLGVGMQSGIKKTLGEGFQVTSRSVSKDDQGRRQVLLWARYVGGTELTS